MEDKIIFDFGIDEGYLEPKGDYYVFRPAYKNSIFDRGTFKDDNNLFMTDKDIKATDKTLSPKRKKVLIFLLKFRKNLLIFTEQNFYFFFSLWFNFIKEDSLVDIKRYVFKEPLIGLLDKTLDFYLKFYYVFFYLSLVKDYNPPYYRDRREVYNNYTFLLRYMKKGLRIKDRKSLIYLETDEDLELFKFSPKFYFNQKKIGILLPSHYKFRISFYYFVLARSYMDYFRKFYYNEYLNSTKALWKYPLLKTLLRHLWRIRIRKRRLDKRIFLSNQSVLNQFQILDGHDEVNMDYDSLTYWSKQSKYKRENYFDLKIFKFAHILRTINLRKFYEKKFYNFLYMNSIKRTYEVNLFHYEEIKLAQVEKLFADDIGWLCYSMIKTAKLGYQLKYYMYYLKMQQLLASTNLLNVSNYNKLYLSSSLDLFEKNNYLNYYWYKLITMTFIDYFHEFFFIYMRFTWTLFTRRKTFITRKYNRYLNFLLKGFNLFFLKVNIKSYNRNLKKSMIYTKRTFDYFTWKTFFEYNTNFRDYTYNLSEIYNKRDIDTHLNGIMISYLNNFFILFKKRKGNKRDATMITAYPYFRYFNKYQSYYNLLNDFFWKLLFSHSFTYNNWIFYDQRDYNYLVLNQQNYSNFFFRFLYSKYFYFTYFYEYEFEFLWDFEFVLIYNTYEACLWYNYHNILIIMHKFFWINKKHVDAYEKLMEQWRKEDEAEEELERLKRLHGFID